MFMRIFLIVLISILTVVVIAVATVVTRLIAKRKQVVKGYGTIDVQLKRRGELVGEVAEIAKSKQEPFGEIIDKFVFLNTRAQTVNSPIEREHFENALSCSLAEFFSAVKGREEYNSCPKFAKLLKNLDQVENDLRTSTSFYNEITEQFNHAVDGVPARFIAPIFSIEPQPLFHFDSAQQKSGLPKHPHYSAGSAVPPKKTTDSTSR